MKLEIFKIFMFRMRIYSMECLRSEGKFERISGCRENFNWLCDVWSRQEELLNSRKHYEYKARQRLDPVAQDEIEFNAMFPCDSEVEWTGEEKNSTEFDEVQVSDFCQLLMETLRTKNDVSDVQWERELAGRAVEFSFDLPIGNIQDRFCANLVALHRIEQKFDCSKSESDFQQQRSRIYFDPYPGEVLLLLNAVEAVQTLLSDRLKQWPEHAGLQNIQEKIDRLKKMHHKQPLMRIANSVEDLLGNFSLNEIKILDEK